MSVGSLSWLVSVTRMAPRHFAFSTYSLAHFPSSKDEGSRLRISNPSLLRIGSTLSDRGSEGHILVHVSSGSTRRQVVILDALVEASASRSTKSLFEDWPDFSCQRVNSTLRGSDIARIRSRYSIPTSFSLGTPAPRVWSYDCLKGFITLYEDTFLAGVHLPLHPLA